jgi:hypothetical protein
VSASPASVETLLISVDIKRAGRKVSILFLVSLVLSAMIPITEVATLESLDLMNSNAFLRSSSLLKTKPCYKWWGKKNK